MKTLIQQDHVNSCGRMLWSAKAFYGLSAAAGAFFSPYVSILLADRGASGSTLGAVSAVRPWLGIISSTLGPLLADRLNCHRSMLVATTFLCAALRALMWYGSNVAQISALLLLSEVLYGSSSSFVDSMVVANCAQAGADYGRQRLWGSAAFGSMSPLAGWTVGRYGIGVSLLIHVLLVLPSLYLAACLRYPPGYEEAAKGYVTVDSRDQQLGTGPVVNTGTQVSTVHSTTTIATEHAAHHRHPVTHTEADNSCTGKETHAALGSQSNDAVMHPQGTVVSLKLPHIRVTGPEPEHKTDVWTPRSGRSTPRPTTVKANLDDGVEVECILHVDEETAMLLGSTKSVGAATFQAKVRALFTSPAVWTLLLKTFALGFGSGMVATYLFLYARDQGASPTLSGLLLTFDCMAEVLVFWYQRLLLSWLGSVKAMHLCIGGLVLRLMLYAFVAFAGLPPWYILFIELLNGLTFAGGWAAASVDCLKLAPPGLAATLQGCMSSTYYGLGSGLGALLGGFMLQAQLSWAATWAASGSFVIALWAACVATDVISHKCVHARGMVVTKQPYTKLSVCEKEDACVP